MGHSNSPSHRLVAGSLDQVVVATNPQRMATSSRCHLAFAGQIRRHPLARRRHRRPHSIGLVRRDPPLERFRRRQLSHQSALLFLHGRRQSVLRRGRGHVGHKRHQLAHFLDHCRSPSRPRSSGRQMQPVGWPLGLFRPARRAHWLLQP